MVEIKPDICVINFISTTTSVISGTGTVYYCVVHVSQSLVFCVVIIL